MPLIQEKPFQKMRLDEEKADDKSKVVPVRLNVDELKQLEEAGVILNEEKLSSVIKNLMSFGLIVIHKPETTAVLEAIFRNKKNSKRRGVNVIEPKFSKM